MNKVMNVHYVNEILHFPSVSVFWYFVLKYLSTNSDAELWKIFRSPMKNKPHTATQVIF